MPWNGGGVFTRAYSWVQDALASIPITASRMDGEFDNFATGLNDCVTKDGQNTPSANLPMGTFRHTGVGNAVARTDYAAAGQVQDNTLQYAGTSGGTANAQTLSPAPAITGYAHGSRFLFKVGGALTNTATMTMQISAIATPKKIYLWDGASELAGGELVAGRVVEIEYDSALNAAAGAFRLIGPPALGEWYTIKQTASNSSSISCPIPSWADEVEFSFYDVVPVTSTAFLQAVVSIAASYQVGSNYTYNNLACKGTTASQTRTNGASSIGLVGATATTSGYAIAGEARMKGPAGTANYKVLRGKAWGLNSSTSTEEDTDFSGYWGGATGAIDGVRFLMSSGNISAGSFVMRCRKNS